MHSAASATPYAAGPSARESKRARPEARRAQAAPARPPRRAARHAPKPRARKCLSGNTKHVALGVCRGVAPPRASPRRCSHEKTPVDTRARRCPRPTTPSTRWEGARTRTRRLFFFFPDALELSFATSSSPRFVRLGVAVPGPPPSSPASRDVARRSALPPDLSAASNAARSSSRSASSASSDALVEKEDAARGSSFSDRVAFAFASSPAANDENASPAISSRGAGDASGSIPASSPLAVDAGRSGDEDGRRASASPILLFVFAGARTRRRPPPPPPPPAGRRSARRARHARASRSRVSSRASGFGSGSFLSRTPRRTAATRLGRETRRRTASFSFRRCANRLAAFSPTARRLATLATRRPGVTGSGGAARSRVSARIGREGGGRARFSARTIAGSSVASGVVALFLAFRRETDDAFSSRDHHARFFKKKTLSKNRCRLDLFGLVSPGTDVRRTGDVP